nr:reverse transcriptase domain-containing protein [Tanacetum cinerariifolium]
SLNAASGGNLLNKTTREALKIIENKSKVRYSRRKSNVSRVNTNSKDVVSKTDDRIDKLVDPISNLVEIVNKQVIAPAKECMRTRSNFYLSNSTATIPRRSNRRRIPNIVEPKIRTIVEIVLMADRTIEELLQAPKEVYGEAIVISEILAENFKIKTNLLQDVSNDAIKLMFFPYSLEGTARIWYEKEPPNSILTWDDLVNKFFNQFFPPSKTTHLKNEIPRFTQRFEETFREA